MSFSPFFALDISVCSAGILHLRRREKENGCLLLFVKWFSPPLCDPPGYCASKTGRVYIKDLLIEDSRVIMRCCNCHSLLCIHPLQVALCILSVCCFLFPFFEVVQKVRFGAVESQPNALHTNSLALC